ncbi:MAG: hypothetical protein WB579_11260 [Bryobacteraceae bacterium]
MEIEDIGEVIAERVLKRSVNHTEPQDVVVRLGKPRQYPDGTDYFCPFEIIGLGEPKIRKAAGVDAFHSLQLVLRMISALLQHYKREPSVDLFWLEQGDDLGFPEET